MNIGSTENSGSQFFSHARFESCRYTKITNDKRGTSSKTKLSENSETEALSKLSWKRVTTAFKLNSVGMLFEKAGMEIVYKEERNWRIEHFIFQNHGSKVSMTIFFSRNVSTSYFLRQDYCFVGFLLYENSYT